jgi:hypothetical protein
MIDPVNMSLTEWADAVMLTVADTWSFGRLDDENKWQDWAVGFVRAPSLAQRVLPDPYQFTDWRDWAQRVYPMLERTV